MPKKKWIAMSVALHVAVAGLVLFAGFRPATSTGQQPEPMMTTRLSPKPVDVPPAPKADPAPSTEVPDIEPPAPSPVKYAGAPPEVDLVDRVLDGTEPSTARPSAPDDFVEHLQRAVALHREGARVPDYTADALSEHIVRAIVSAGLGHVVASRAPFGTELVSVEWETTGPAKYTLLQSGTWPAGVSDRGVELPPSLAQQVKRGIRDWFGISPRDFGVYLVVSTALDQAILAEQLRACEALNLELDAVARTSGRFTFDRGRIPRFTVHIVTLVDGRTLRVDSNGQ